MEALPNLWKMHLLNAVWWTGDLSLAHCCPEGSVALCPLIASVLMPVTTFPDLAQQTYLADKYLLFLCWSGFLPGYWIKPVQGLMSWSLELLWRETSVGELFFLRLWRWAMWLWGGFLPSAHILRDAGRRLIFSWRNQEEGFFPHWFQWELYLS